MRVLGIGGTARERDLAGVGARTIARISTALVLSGVVLLGQTLALLPRRRASQMKANDAGTPTNWIIRKTATTVDFLNDDKHKMEINKKMDPADFKLIRPTGWTLESKPLGQE